VRSSADHQKPQRIDDMLKYYPNRRLGTDQANILMRGQGLNKLAGAMARIVAAKMIFFETGVQFLHLEKIMDKLRRRARYSFPVHRVKRLSFIGMIFDMRLSVSVWHVL
jgi:hypothetical protein